MRLRGTVPATTLEALGSTTITTKRLAQHQGLNGRLESDVTRFLFRSCLSRFPPHWDTIFQLMLKGKVYFGSWVRSRGFSCWLQGRSRIAEGHSEGTGTHLMVAKERSGKGGAREGDKPVTAVSHLFHPGSTSSQHFQGCPAMIQHLAKASCEHMRAWGVSC